MRNKLLKINRYSPINDKLVSSTTFNINDYTFKRISLRGDSISINAGEYEIHMNMNTETNQKLYELIHNFLIYDSNKIYLEIDLNLGVSGSVIMFKEVER